MHGDQLNIDIFGTSFPKSLNINFVFICESN